MARYDFCEDNERRQVSHDLHADYRAAKNKLGEEDVSNIRIVFRFTSNEGLRTDKMFKSLTKLDHFLFGASSYWREQAPGRGKPDWSVGGLCQYGKYITLGVAKFKGDRFLGFKKVIGEYQGLA